MKGLSLTMFKVVQVLGAPGLSLAGTKHRPASSIDCSLTMCALPTTDAVTYHTNMCAYLDPPSSQSGIVALNRDCRVPLISPRDTRKADGCAQGRPATHDHWVAGSRQLAVRGASKPRHVKSARVERGSKLFAFALSCAVWA